MCFWEWKSNLLEVPMNYFRKISKMWSMQVDGIALDSYQDHKNKKAVNYH